MHNLSKEFSGIRVLDGVELSVKAGEVRAFLGGNGSGKSTLIKILSGYHRPEPGGSVTIGGQALRFGSTQLSYRIGCRVIQQDGDLIGELSVLDNLCLTAGFPVRFGTVRRREALRQARADIAQLELDLDPHALVSELSLTERTSVALVRALRDDSRFPARLLILDEPTATLPIAEVNHLAAIVRRVAERGVGVLYVSHRLEETFAVADSVTILRDGVVVKTGPLEGENEGSLARLITGFDVKEFSRLASGPTHDASPSLLKVANLKSGVLHNVNFEVRPGEIVGLAGITGSGRERLLGAIFGAVSRGQGLVTVGGRPVSNFNPHDAVRAGMAFLPADRKEKSGVMDMSARENMTLANLAPFFQRGWLSAGGERREAATWAERLGVMPRNATEKPLATFSGGNQQKLLFAKWLRCRPSVLLLDEPTQGVDIAAKYQIHELVANVADEGAGIVVSSSDLIELASLCHRVLVLHEGGIVAEVPQSEHSLSLLTELALGAAVKESVAR